MPAIEPAKNSPYLTTMKNWRGEGLPVLKFTTEVGKTPFTETNEMLNEAVNHVSAALLVRPATPFVAAYGLYKDKGVGQAIVGLGAGTWFGAGGFIRDLGITIAATFMAPSVTAMEGAKFLVKRHEKTALESAEQNHGAYQKPSGLGYRLADTAYHPIEGDPVQVLNSSKPAGDNWEKAGQNLAKAGNRVLNLGVRTTTPFVSSYGAGVAALGQKNGAAKMAVAGTVGLVGGVVNGGAGMVADVAVAGTYVARAGGNAVAGVSKKTRQAIDSAIVAMKDAWNSFKH